MCIICVSGRGVKQPTKARIKAMFENNPHGAGYMFVRKGAKRVEVRKGFMNFGDLWDALTAEGFTDDDVVVYHFRISTQAGVQPAMTQPFPVTRELKATRELKISASMGMAHNGVIRLTSDAKEHSYSDTALFDARYLSYLVRSEKDLHDDVLMDSIEKLIASKMVILDKGGNYRLIGKFINDDNGLWYSNDSYEERDWELWYDDDGYEYGSYWHFDKASGTWKYGQPKTYKSYKKKQAKAYEASITQSPKVVKSPYTGAVRYERPDTVAEMLEAQQKFADSQK